MSTPSNFNDLNEIKSPSYRLQTFGKSYNYSKLLELQTKSFWTGQHFLGFPTLNSMYAKSPCVALSEDANCCRYPKLKVDIAMDKAKLWYTVINKKSMNAQTNNFET